MARAFGLALAPWNVLAGGKFRSSKEETQRAESGEGGRTLAGDWHKGQREIQLTEKLEEIAREFGDDVDPTAGEVFPFRIISILELSKTPVAIAYLMHKTPFVFPIIGGRKVSHLKSNIKALEISLTPEHISALEDISPFEPGFPNNFVVSVFLVCLVKVAHSLGLEGRWGCLWSQLESGCLHCP
jgi:aryl-alcohol dehydrogenase-like predicted oxidoreductase